MRLHIEALFTHNAQGDLVRVNEPSGKPAPRFFLGRTAEGAVWRFGHDVEREVRRELEAALEAEPLPTGDLDSPTDASPYVEILARAAPVERTSTGPAFTFPAELPGARDAIRVSGANAHLLEPLLHEWLPDVTLSQPLFVVVADGHAVSICGSVRQTTSAFEAGVETAPAFRGRGYAARVAAAWARAVRELGRVPLYSTSWENERSRAVARKLGLIRFGSDLHVT